MALSNGCGELGLLPLGEEGRGGGKREMEIEGERACIHDDVDMMLGGGGRKPRMLLMSDIDHIDHHHFPIAQAQLLSCTTSKNPMLQPIDE